MMLSPLNINREKKVAKSIFKLITIWKFYLSINESQLEKPPNYAEAYFNLSNQNGLED